MTWETPTDDPEKYRANLIISLNCGGFSVYSNGSGYQADGHIEVSLDPYRLGRYEVIVRTQVRDGTGGYEILDFDFIGTFQSAVYNGNDLNGASWTRKGFSGINFTTECNKITLDGTSEINISGEHPYCGSVPAMDLDDFVTLSIIEGNEYVSFYDSDHNFIGDNIQDSFSELANIYIKNDSENLGVLPSAIIMEASANEISITKTIIVYPKSGPYQINSPQGNEADPIIHNDIVPINGTLVAENICGGERGPIPEGIKFQAEIITGGNYGELVNPANESTGQILTDV